MIMIFLDTLELIERKHGILGTVFGIVLILLITIAAVFAIYNILHVWFHSLNVICFKYFGFWLY